MPRIVIFGNSGSGKTTMARAIAAAHRFPHLDLDSVAWTIPTVRKPVEESARDIDAFCDMNRDWVAEGCYADLLALLTPRATQVLFLNPGTEACIANCRARPWEPTKYESPEAQDRMLDMLIEWVKQYETRDDEYSLARHRALFDDFEGTKLEITR